MSILNAIPTLSGSPDWLSSLPWSAAEDRAWSLARSLLSSLSPGGVYEVLDYESTLELLNRSGTKATFRKPKWIRYLQDDIIAHQDHVWGDGEALLNYRTNLGKPVDRYHCGHKTYILSLRGGQKPEDIDELDVQWDIRRGFLKEDGFWGTDVNQRMEHLKINVIFPGSRPPQQFSLEGSNRLRTTPLGKSAQHQK